MLPTMTASNTSAGNGHESGDECGDEYADTLTAFERFARQELAVLFRMQPTYAEEASRRIADDVEAGRSVDREDALDVRKESKELLRLTEGALLASGSDGEADREALAGSAHEASHEMHQAVLDLEQKMLNGEGVERRDLERVLSWSEKLDEAMVRIASELSEGEQ